MLRMIASTTRWGEVIFAVRPAMSALWLPAARRLAGDMTVSMVICPGVPRSRSLDVSRRTPRSFPGPACLSRVAATIKATFRGLSPTPTRHLLFVRPHHHLDLRRRLAQRFERGRELIERNDIGDHRPGINATRV